MGKSSIEWTDFTVNPIRARNRETGNVGHFCEKISPACTHCYAAAWNVARRHRTAVAGTGVDFLPANESLVEHFFDENVLQEVLRRKKPTKFFWCDMTDLFGHWVRDAWRDACFAIMARTPQHTHQVLTKRAKAMHEYFTVRRAGGWPWPLENVWLGVTAEDQQRADERIPWLLKMPAAVRYVSAEPLLGSLDLTHGNGLTGWDYLRGWNPDVGPEGANTSCLDQVIAGFESGPHARIPVAEWAQFLRDQCVGADVAFFFKQWGEWLPPMQDGTRGPDQWINCTDQPLRVGKKRAGRLLDGREWSEFPRRALPSCTTKS